MKKITALLICCFFLPAAWSQAIETKALYNKTEQPAVTAVFDYTVDFVEETIIEDLKQKGFGKGKSLKGYTLYQAINFKEIGSDKIDFYFKTEKKSKKEKEKAILTVLISKGYDNFVSSATDANIIQGVINYLNSLKPKLIAANLVLLIKEQEDQVRKEEKKYNALLDEQSDLEKKKRKVEEDIINNKKDQEKQKGELEKQRQLLELLTSQKKA